MKTLALLLISVLGFAQTPKAPSSLHLLDQTNPSAKRETSSANPGINYAQFCFEKAAGSKEETWKYDQALQSCITTLHGESKTIGHANCKKIASAITDGNIKNEILSTCEDYYGYEGCMSAPKASARDCIVSKASSLSAAECEEQLKAHGLTKDRKLMNICKNGSTLSSSSKPSGPARHKKSNQ